MTHDTKLPPGFMLRAASNPKYVNLYRDGVLIGGFLRELPMADAVMAKVAREHVERFPNWPQRRNA